MSRPTVDDLQVILHDLVEWELAGIHLRGFSKTEIEKIQKEFRNASLEEQKLSLYSRWSSLCPDAMWDDVVSALEKAKETRLAEKVKNEKIANVTKPKQNQITFSFKEKEEKELIQELKQINHSFALLLRDVRLAIEKFSSFQEIVENILDAQIKSLPPEVLRKCQATSELIDVLRKNCRFLDGSILDRVVEYGFPKGNDELKCRTKEHMDKVKAFKSKAPLKLLKEILKEKIEEDSIQTILIVKLNNEWDKVTFDHVEELILALAGIHAKAVRINNGSVEITFMISRDKIMCFNITAQKRQLMCLIGVFYLQVGDERLFIEDENIHYTFENGLLEAGKIGHIQATKFILNMNIVNINHQDNEGRTALMLASEHGHIEVLNLILSAGANVNIQDHTGQTAVMVAKTVEIYQTLKQAKANTSIVTHKGSTPLMISCFLGNHEVANHLLFTLNHEIPTRPDGLTLLMAASEGGNQRIVEHLLINGADPNVQDNDGTTALLSSCFEGHYAVTEILLKYNADPNILDYDGWTPVMAASDEGHYLIVELLLQNEADPHIISFTADADGECEKYALVLASENGHTETVEILLKFANKYIYFELESYPFRIEGYERNDYNEYFQEAMELSCLNGHYKVTETLLNYATKHECKNIRERTLTNASCNGHYKIVQLLLNFFRTNQNERDFRRVLSTALITASQNGHNEIVNLLIANGAKPNKFYQHDTAIILSSLNGHYEVTKTLLKYQSDLSITNSEGWTALTAASYNGHLKIVELLLLKKKLDPNFRDYKKGPTALMMASAEGHLSIINLLLSNGADPNIQDNNGVTAILLSCFKGHYTVAEILLNHKADLSISDKHGYTSLMNASLKGHQEIVQMLLLQGRVDPNTRNIHGQTALMLASKNGQNEIVESLLSNGADSNTQDNVGTTAIWLSCFKGHYTVTEILLKCNADLNISNKDGWTPLMIATQKEHHKIVQILLVQEKVNLNVTNIRGQTALILACYREHTETVELLLSNGADPNIQDNNGVTSLWLSCSKGHYTIAEILLKHNADPNLSYKNTLTPMMAASQKGHHEIVELLLQKGEVDPNTAIVVACEHNQYHIVTTLLKAGADPLHVDSKGRDPLTVITQYTQSCEILELLQNNLINEREIRKFCLKGMFISLSSMNHSLVNYFMGRISNLPDTIDTVVQHYDRQDMVSLKQLSQQENISGQWLEYNTIYKQQPLKEKMIAMALDLFEQVPHIDIQDIDYFKNFSRYGDSTLYMKVVPG